MVDLADFEERKIRPSTIGGGESVPRDITDLKMSDIDSVFFCHVAAFLIPLSGYGTHFPAWNTTDSAWFRDLFSHDGQ